MAMNAVVASRLSILSSPKFRFALSALLLGGVLSLIDVGETLTALRHARLDFVLLVLGVGLLGRFYAAWRWYILLHGKSPEVTYFRILRLTFVSTFAGFLLPGMIGVELTRVYGLSRTTSDLALTVSSIFVERAFAVAALIVVVLLGFAISPPGLPEDLGLVAWFGLALIAAVSFAVMNPGMRRLIDAPLSLSWLAPVRDLLNRFYACLDDYKDQPRLLAWSVAAAALSPLFRVLPAIFAAWALRLDVSVVHLFILVPMVVFLAQLPISLGGLGMREIGFVSLLGLIGVSPEAAVALSLMLYAAAIIGALPGAWFYARHGLSPKGQSSVPRP